MGAPVATSSVEARYLHQPVIAQQVRDDEAGCGKLLKKRPAVHQKRAIGLIRGPFFYTIPLCF